MNAIWIKSAVVFLFAVSLVIILLALNLSLLESLSCAFFILYLLYFIDLIGKRIIVFELTVLLAALTWLVLPVIFYHFYDLGNDLAIKWDKYMRVPSSTYFAYVLPATIVMAVGIHVPFKNKNELYNTKVRFVEIRDFLKNKSIVGYVLVVIGLIFLTFNDIVPASLQFVSFLFGYLTVVGLLYVAFSKSRHKWLALLSGFLLLAYQSLSTSMFGQLVFISILAALLLVSNRSLKLHSKILGLLIGTTIIVMIQSVKYEYRRASWGEGASPALFFSAISKRLSEPAKIIEPYQIFSMATRANQGWLIAYTMYKVPKYRPYAYGETVLKSLVATVVPRILWKDKPKSGGEFNLERFLGIRDLGYSMNIGPVGEAYANFGVFGGIVFMFLYGLLLNIFLSVVLGFVKFNPTLLLWFPVLFLFPIGTETDILSTINPLVKIGLFLIGAYTLFPRLLGIKL